MFTLKKFKLIIPKSTMSSILKFLIIVIISIIIAALVQESWTNNLNLYHTILELVCIFVAFSIFISIWYTYNKSDHSSYALGFGFLAVAVFDTLHAYYHLKLNLSVVAYFDLSTWFWILGRLTEAITILLAVTSCKIFTSKYMNILFSLGITSGLFYFMVNYYEALPLLLTADGVTPLKLFLEYVIIGIYLISLTAMRGKNQENSNITYRYIFIALLLSISSEICFTKYSVVSNFSWTLGHIMKIISYFYLFKGTFISTVIFPYDELALKNVDMRATNEKLGKMSNTMKDMLDALPIAVQKYGTNGRLKYGNKKLEELLQCNRKELEDLTMLEVANMFVAEKLDEKTLKFKLSESRKAYIIESFITLKGEPIKLAVRSQRIRNGTMLMFSDAKREQELQNLNIQTETILNAINNGVMMIDKSMKIILFNKVFEEIYEINRDAVLGMDIEHLNMQTKFEANQLIEKLLNENSTSQAFDVSITSFKGSKRELNFSTSPIKNIEGAVIGAIIIGADMTGQNEEKQRMMQQEKLALLGQMGAGIVHETRNYLTTIKGRCQLIDMQTNDEVIKKHSTKINSDVDEVNRIMSEFLFMAKPKEIELVEVSIYEVFESIKGMIEASSLIRGVTLEIKMCGEDRYMLCDESQLKQVILNICKNGIDAMANQPDAKLFVETGFSEENNEVFIHIKDNGKGISSGNLDKIGTPFFTTKSTGTGLGLSVCYKIIKDHGGRIEVQSEVGKGTRFTIVLPCIEDDELEDII